MIVCFPQKGFDVFNALDLMENKVFLEKLKFGIGDGNLQYYLYNWRCPPMDPEKVRPSHPLNISHYCEGNMSQSEPSTCLLCCV